MMTPRDETVVAPQDDAAPGPDAGAAAAATDWLEEALGDPERKKDLMEFARSIVPDGDVKTLKDSFSKQIEGLKTQLKNSAGSEELRDSWVEYYTERLKVLGIEIEDEFNGIDDAMLVRRIGNAALVVAGTIPKVVNNTDAGPVIVDDAVEAYRNKRREVRLAPTNGRGAAPAPAKSLSQLASTDTRPMNAVELKAHSDALDAAARTGNVG